MEKYGITMNLDQTKVRWVGKQTQELNNWLEGDDIKQVKVAVYLVINTSENSRVEVKVRCRIQAGANT